MDTPPTLSVIDRFAQIMDGLCALLLAQIEPRTWVGRLFGAPTRPLVLRFHAEMRALSEFFRSIAAGLAVDPPVVPHADACVGRSPTGCPTDGGPEKLRPVVAARRAARRLANDGAEVVAACALDQVCVVPVRDAGLTPVRPLVVAGGCAAFEVPMVSATGGVFFELRAVPVLVCLFRYD